MPVQGRMDIGKSNPVYDDMYVSRRLRPFKPWMFGIYKRIQDQGTAVVTDLIDLAATEYPARKDSSNLDEMRRIMRSLIDAEFVEIIKDHTVGAPRTYSVIPGTEEACLHACMNRGMPIPAQFRKDGEPGYQEGILDMGGRMIHLATNGQLRDAETNELVVVGDRPGSAGFKAMMVQRQQMALNAIVQGIADVVSDEQAAAMNLYGEDRMAEGLRQITANMAGYAKDERSSGSVRAFEALIRVAKLAGDTATDEGRGIKLESSEEALTNLAFLISTIRDMRKAAG